MRNARSTFPRRHAFYRFLVRSRERDDSASPARVIPSTRHRVSVTARIGIEHATGACLRGERPSATVSLR